METRQQYHADQQTADTHIRGLSVPLVRQLRKAAIDRSCNLATVVNEAGWEWLERHNRPADVDTDREK